MFQAATHHPFSALSTYPVRCPPTSSSNYSQNITASKHKLDDLVYCEMHVTKTHDGLNNIGAGPHALLGTTTTASPGHYSK